MESHAAAGEFDILGFSLQYELQYTNVLAMLDLAGVPLRTVERNERHPLVIAGGAQAFSPEPMAEFIDAFVIGDGEEVIHRVVDLVAESKRERWTRARLLTRTRPRARRLRAVGLHARATAEGWLVPVPRPGFPSRVESVWVETLKSELLPGRTAAADRRDHARPAARSRSCAAARAAAASARRA